jgi:rhamnosyltransferase
MSNARAPRVLVLMAAYNGARWIEEQLASILGQGDVEVVVRVSDDCSSDETAVLVRGLAVLHGNLSVHVRAASSGSAGANFKSMLADADLGGFDHVALADQDDVWDPDHLSRGCTALRADAAAGGYSCAVRTFGAGEPVVLAQNSFARPLDFLFEGAGQGCTFVMPVATARLAQEACRAWPLETAALHYHDWMIYLIARCSGRGWIFDSHPSLAYRQHGNNEIGARSSGGAVRRRLNLIRQGWYARQVGAAWALATVSASSSASPRSDLERFGAVFAARRSPSRRLKLMWLVLRDGRRRFADRLVLGVSALAGWV